MDESSAWNNERLQIAQLIHLIQQSQYNSDSQTVVTLPFMKSLKFDANKHSPKCINNFKLLIHNNNYDSIQLSDFRLASARLARKQMNYNLASRLITEHLNIIQANNKTTSATSVAQNNNNIFDNIKLLLNENNRLFLKTTNQQTRIQLLECELETAKLLYELSRNEKKTNSLDSVSLLVKSIYTTTNTTTNITTNTTINQLNQLFINPIQANNSNSLISNDLINEMCARSILTLFKWLKRSSGDLNLLKDININLDLLMNKQIFKYDNDNMVENIAINLLKIIDLKKKYKTNTEQNNFLELNGKLIFIYQNLLGLI